MTTNRIRQVLVVDDEPDIRQFLEMTLQMSDYDVITAGDGLEAEALARSVLPDVIILDVMMPGIDGISVLRNLRSDPVTQEIPVVLLTAKSSDPDVWSGWEAGANYYMAKPFDIDHLLRFLRSLEDPEGASLNLG